MRTHTIDTVFEMIGGTERLAHWAGKNDDNYGEYVTKVWAKGAAKAVVQEHSLGEGVEDLLAQLARAENAQTIEGAYEETLESD